MRQQLDQTGGVTWDEWVEGRGWKRFRRHLFRAGSGSPRDRI